MSDDPGTELTVFHFDESRPSFEDLGVANGSRKWLESDLMVALDYQNIQSFRRVVMRAQQACLTLGIAIEDNFERLGDGYKFTRFACYLIAMNGDPKKPQVAAAQAYFAALAETFQTHLDHANNIDRVLVRQEVTDGMKSLQSTAKSHGVANYAFFVNQGYRGMYNMDLARLLAIKRIDPKETLFDRIGKEELAANLFRITQTEAKIKNDEIRGQGKLEAVAYEVGWKVRNTMLELSGTPPEQLPAAEPIQSVKKRIKGTNKKFSSLDKKD
ncbi:MAG: damage-inducible protein D [Planctomycetia bacterium]|nr:damage-inducible protein D [Planctomycetia bacterium]